MKTKAEQRIEIAKDVLKWIKTGKIKVLARNCYFNPITNLSYSGEQLKDALPQISNCEVCALGGLFYAHIMRYNDFEIDRWGINYIDGRREMVGELKMFSERVLQNIEASFEATNEYKDKHKLSDDTETLKHIMNNIIKNKGTFKP